MAPDVFIAFAKGSEQEARLLKAELGRRWIRSWLAPEDVPPGAEWSREVEGAQRSSRLTVALITERASTSSHWLAEVERAVTAQRVVPVMLDEWSRRPERWPGRLADFQGVTWDVARVADAVEARLRGPTSTTTLPSRELVDRIRAWLDGTYGREPARRGLMLSAGLAGDPSRPWADLLTGLPAHALERLLREAGEEHEVGEFVEALRHVSGPVDIEAVLEAELNDQIERARDLLAAERYAEAEEAYARIEARAAAARPGSRAWSQMVQRARLNRAAAINGRGGFPESFDLLRTIDADLLPPRGRINLGRFLAVAGDTERALAAISAVDEPGAEIVRQLVTLERGELPQALADDPDVQLRAATLLLGRLRVAGAVEHALRALDAPGINDQGRCSAARVLVQALLQVWTGAATEHVERPAAVLQRVRQLIAERGAAHDWSVVEQIRRVCELEELDEGDSTPGGDSSTLPPWVSELYGVPGSADRLGALRELARRWPDVGPVQVELAWALLSAGHSSEASAIARRAFDLLPGSGQRILLASSLVDEGDPAEVALHLDALTGDDREQIWELRLRAALTAGNGDPVAIGDGWATRWPASSRPWPWLVHAHLLRGDVRAARAAADRALADTEQLSVEGLSVLAGAALAAGEPVDGSLARRVASILQRRFPEDAEAEQIRMQLLLALGEDARDAPVDWELLVRSGRARPVTVEETVELIEEQRRLHEAADRLWLAGGIVFEHWATLRGFGAGLAALAVTRGELCVPPPLPPVSGVSSTWRDRRCLIGALGIELLVAAGVHRAFTDAVAEVVLFEDAYERIMNGGIATEVGPYRAELARTADAWTPFADLGTLEIVPPGGELLTAEDVPSIIAWLARAGRIPRVEGPEPWVPPSGPVVVAADLIDELHRRGVVAAFAAEARATGLPLAIDAESVRLRRARTDELELRIRGTELAAEAFRCVGGLRAAGRLRVVTVPRGPPLPVAPDRPTDPDWVGRVFAARELLQIEPELVLVSTEFAELGVHLHGPAVVVEGRQWTRESWEELRRRYQGVADRYVTLSSVARDLVADGTGRDQALAHFARAGFLDAYRAPDVVRLFHAYDGLLGAEPRTRLMGLVRSMRGERHPHHTVAAGELALRLAADVVARAWLEKVRHPDSEALTRSMLDVVEEMERSTRGALRLLDLTFQGLVLQSLANVLRFAAPVGDAEVVPSPASAGMHMWDVIADWARLRPDRTTAMDLGVAAAVHRRTGSTRVTRAVLGAIVATVPKGPGVFLAGSSMAAMLNGKEPEILEGFTIGGRAAAEWRARAVVAAQSGCELRGLDVVVPVEGADVTLALEGALPDLDLELAKEIVGHLWSDDGGVAEALSAWANSPQDDHLRSLRLQLDRSPVRAVREDPRIVLAWSRWSDRAVPGPRSARDLIVLLSEPMDRQPEETLVQMLQRRVDEGAWMGRNFQGMGRQLSRLPGGLVGVGVGRLPLDDQRLRELLRLSEHVEQAPAGLLADVIVTLGRVAETTPVRRIGEEDVRLVDLLTRIVFAALSDPSAPRDRLGIVPPRPYGACEPDLVRACGEVVRSLHPVAPFDLWVWLSWRLYGWLSEQIRQARDPLAAAQRLADAAPRPAPPSECGPDLYDPRRIAPDRVDLRELVVVQALADLRAQGTADWRGLRPALLQVALRAWSADERSLRETWREPTLGGRALIAPDLARGILLSVDGDVIGELDAATRMSWLDDALVPRPEDAPLRANAEHTLLVFAVRAHLWTAAELARIEQAVQDPAFAARGVGARTLLIAATGREVGHPLHASTLGVVDEALDTDVGPLVGAEWLLASARRGRLADAVQWLRDRHPAGDAQPFAHLNGLARVVLGGERAEQDQAIAVLHGLAADPEVAGDGALAELLQYIAQRVGV